MNVEKRCKIWRKLVHEASRENMITEKFKIHGEDTKNKMREERKGKQRVG